MHLLTKFSRNSPESDIFVILSATDCPYLLRLMLIFVDFDPLIFQIFFRKGKKIEERKQTPLPFFSISMSICE